MGFETILVWTVSRAARGLLGYLRNFSKERSAWNMLGFAKSLAIGAGLGLFGSTVGLPLSEATLNDLSAYPIGIGIVGVVNKIASAIYDVVNTDNVVRRT